MNIKNKSIIVPCILLFVFLIVILSPVCFAVTEKEVDDAIAESNNLIEQLIKTSISDDELVDMKSFVEGADAQNAGIGLKTNLAKTLEDKRAELKNESTSSAGKPWVWLMMGILALVIIFGSWYFARKAKSPTPEDTSEEEQDEIKLEVLENDLLKLWDLKKNLVRKNIEESQLLVEEEKKESKGEEASLSEVKSETRKELNNK